MFRVRVRLRVRVFRVRVRVPDPATAYRCRRQVLSEKKLSPNFVKSAKMDFVSFWKSLES